MGHCPTDASWDCCMGSWNKSNLEVNVSPLYFYISNNRKISATNKLIISPPTRICLQMFWPVLVFLLKMAIKTSTSSHRTHVISLSPQAKRYVLILITCKLLIPLTCLKCQSSRNKQINHWWAFYWSWTEGGGIEDIWMNTLEVFTAWKSLSHVTFY